MHTTNVKGKNRTGVSTLFNPTTYVDCHLLTRSLYFVEPYLRGLPSFDNTSGCNLVAQVFPSPGTLIVSSLVVLNIISFIGLRVSIRSKSLVVPLVTIRVKNVDDGIEFNGWNVSIDSRKRREPSGIDHQF